MGIAADEAFDLSQGLCGRECHMLRCKMERSRMLVA